MEQNNSEVPRPCGRGRPKERLDMRRPHSCMNAGGDSDFVPSNDAGSFMVFNSSGGDSVAWSDGREGCGAGNLATIPMTTTKCVSVKIESVPGTFPVSPSGDQVYHVNALNASSPEFRSPPTRTTGIIKSNLSPLAAEFVPRQFQQETRVPQTENSGHYIVLELRQFMNDITYNPAKFERQVQPLTDALDVMVSDEETLRRIVNIIFEESVRQQNFRYSGARLCKILSNELSYTTEHGNFRNFLIERFNREVSHRSQMATADDGGAYLRGLALFSAELFLHLEIPNRKIATLGDNLYVLVDTLLSCGSAENLKCVCQILKLVGWYLEDHEKQKSKNLSPLMDKTMLSLKSLAEKGDFGRDLKDLVNNVIELRSANWGKTTPSHVNSNPVLSESNFLPLNEPVLYGPDGQPITPEESLFLHSQYGCHSTDVDDYEYLDDDAYEELEDEMTAAYELFLRENEIHH